MPAHRRGPLRHQRIMRRLAVIGAAVGLTVTAVSASAWAACGDNGGGRAHTVSTSPQPASNADFSGHGANQHGPYDSTRDGSPSLNGRGDGGANGKPCAGCVGKADNKNPQGQLPGGSDHNAGYECDRNSGVGQSNPAHTGCTTSAATSTPTSRAPSSEAPSSQAVSTPADTAPVSTPAASTPAGAAPTSATPADTVPPASVTETAAQPGAVDTTTPATPSTEATSSAAAPAPADSANPPADVEPLAMAGAIGLDGLDEQAPAVGHAVAADSTVRGLAATGVAIGTTIIIAAFLLALGAWLLTVRRQPTGAHHAR